MGSLARLTLPNYYTYISGSLQVNMVYRQFTIALVVLVSAVSGDFVQRYENNAHATNYGKRDFSNFIQSFNDASSATNYGKRDVNRRVIVKRDASQFVQTFNDYSTATNYGKRDADRGYGGRGYGGYRKRDASQFIQTFNDYSSATNYGKRAADGGYGYAYG